MSPLVTIVIPTHQHGRFIGQAIESALAQTYRETEIVVVDDGSTDDTASVVARYPVRLITQAQAGVCEAANRGLAVASGSYVMRLDGDDVLMPTYVEEMVAALEKDPAAGFAYTDFAYFGSKRGEYRAAEFDAERLAETNYIHASALMRREAFRRAGGYRQDLADSRCEDWDLWLTFAESGIRGVHVGKALLRYRQRGRSVGRNALASRAIVRKLVTMVARLQDHHPATFAPRLLLRRLASLPRRLVRREVSPRHALLLVGFYSVMLIRAGVRGPTSMRSRP